MIDAFDNCEIILRKNSHIIKKYLIYNLLFIFILLIIMVFYKYHPYYNLKATVVKTSDSYYLKTLVLEEDIKNINHQYFYINGTKYMYKIHSISSEYIIDEKYQKYYEAYLESNIDSELVINNNIIDISVELPKTTLMKELKKKIKKGMT